MPHDRAWAELRAHAGTQLDPEIVAAFAQVVDDGGMLRPLGPDLERTLGGGVRVPLSATEALHARLAVLPNLEPRAATVKGVAEDCPVAPPGEDCALLESGEGCEIVVETGDGSGPPSGSRQVA
jgi:hypothetical protein